MLTPMSLPRPVAVAVPSALPPPASPDAWPAYVAVKRWLLADDEADAAAMQTTDASAADARTATPRTPIHQRLHVLLRRSTRRMTHLRHSGSSDRSVDKKVESAVLPTGGASADRIDDVGAR